MKEVRHTATSQQHYINPRVFMINEKANYYNLEKEKDLHRQVKFIKHTRMLVICIEDAYKGQITALFALFLALGRTMM